MGIDAYSRINPNIIWFLVSTTLSIGMPAMLLPRFGSKSLISKKFNAQ